MFWAVSPNGKRLPVDADPVADGEYVIEIFGDVLQLVKFIPNHEPHAKLQRWQSHFRSCPQASSHSKKAQR
jgi:hypothetical protein